MQARKASWPKGLPIQGAVRTATHGPQYSVGVIYLLLKLEVKKGARGLWYYALGLRKFGSRQNSVYPGGHLTLTFYTK